MTIDTDRAEDAERSTEPEPAEQAEPAGKRPTPSRARGGRMLAALALLLSLGSLGGAGYLYYELIHRDPNQAVATQLAAQLAAVTAQVERADQRLAGLAESQQAALQAFRERERAARAATEAALRESLAAVARQAPPSTGEWLRAEVQYLLRIANHRLLMERDAPGALQLLQAADALLTQLDDFSMHPVRARLAEEIAALEAVEGVDLQGLFLRLEVLKNELHGLPLRLPRFVVGNPSESEPVAADGGIWEAVSQHFSGYLRLRRFDAAVKPLLAPDEAVYLELNLRLMLERAQLAAVRGEQLVFEHSLTAASDWIRDHLDSGERPVQRILVELEALQRIDLQRPLPDISGSLGALRDVLRTST
ncbi:MAG: uroporphyrinogen-III C-methyltransferase [Pseudomonadales bacterium]